MKQTAKIIAILLSFVLMFTFVGCGSKTDKNLDKDITVNVSDSITDKQLVKEVQSTLQSDFNLKDDALSKAKEGDSTSILSKYLLNETVIDVVDMNEKTLTLNVKIPDLIKIAQGVKSSDLTGKTLGEIIEFYESFCLNALKNKSYETKEKQFTVSYSSNNGTMQIEYTEELLSFVMGNN